MMLYCKKTNSLASPVRNQGYHLTGGHKWWSWGCSECGEFLWDPYYGDEDDFTGDDGHIVVTSQDMQNLLALKEKGEIK